MDNIQKAGVVVVPILVAVVGILVYTSIDWSVIGGTSDIQLLDYEQKYSEKPIDDFLYGRDVTWSGRVMNAGTGKSDVVDVTITLLDETDTIELDHFTTTTSPAILEAGEEGSFIKIVNERDLPEWGYYRVEVSDTQ